MPNGNNIHYKGTNSQGNDYTAYNDGKYRYTNPRPDGQAPTRYFNDGNGHGFYRKPGPDGYSFHENANQGFRDYKPNNSSKK